MASLFSVPIFFITFREALETSIIVSVFLALIDRTVTVQADAALRFTLQRHIWLGTAAGLLAVVLLGAAVLFGVAGLEGSSLAGAEDIWEASFALAASAIISVMGAVLLRVSKLRHKWRAKLALALGNGTGSNGSAGSNDGSTGSTPAAQRRSGALGLVQRVRAYSEQYALVVLPLVTILREGFEAVVFMAGAGLGVSPWAIVLSALAGLLTGAFVGFLIYKSSNFAPIQYLLIASTCFLYLVGAGLFSKGIWHLEAYQWNRIVGGDAAELGSGPGSYDIRRSVWHVNCCNPDFEGGGFWGVFNAVLGWQNSATVGSVVSYNAYWIAVMAGFISMAAREKRCWPFSQLKAKAKEDEEEPRTGPLQPLLGQRDNRRAATP